jgi:Ser/Thr protein kinase RdoA (MazF antagonist)
MDISAFAFHSLTPDLIVNGLESLDLRIDSGLMALNSYENRVYQFSDEDRKRYVVKFYRPLRWSKAQILEEHQFIEQLADAEVPAVAPLKINGTTVHEYQHYLFAVFPSVGGRQYEMDNLDQLEWVGRFLGRIHSVGRRQPFQERPTVSLEDYLYLPKETLFSSPLIPKSVKPDLVKALDQLIAEVARHWNLDWTSIRLHGDCHSGNILWRDGPLFVDFDDSRNGPAVQDLWMLLHGDRQQQRIQLDILLEAYQEFAEFDSQELALIEPLRAMRMVHYLAWVIRRWQDPAFPKNFPWIADLNFWYKQLSSFNSQIELLRMPPLQLMSAY